MKNLINLFALVLCFTFLASMTVNAQLSIDNKTECDFTVAVHYGNLTSCTEVGILTVTVPANTTANASIPAGNRFLAAKGTYAPTSSPTGCPPFIVGACGSYPTSDSQSCSEQCGDYNANYSPGLVSIFN